ncbi:MAG TPA: cation/multidrug efflux pump [Gammaproteobacteria bacterium]|nr:cation/multidrug efflux pump [Gammaproteobacteria bacterium]
MNHDVALFVYGGLLALFIVLGFYWLGGGVRRVGKRQVVRGGMRGLCGCCFILAGLLLLAVGMNFRLYNRFTHEQPIAEVWFSQVGPQYYSAQIRYPEGGTRLVSLRGDQWQLDARVLKWEAPATILGLDPLYKLERISGRYVDETQARTASYTVYSLGEEPAVNVLGMAEEYANWLPWKDAVYGSATYLPMADRAGYAVSLTNSGLVARPLNEPAQKAVQNW